jgi:pimeloyl-ACP methyl ester carboxylesterase
MLKKYLPTMLVLLILAAGGLAFYFNDGYSADQNAMNAIEQPAAGVVVDNSYDGQIVFIPEKGSEIGIIFYPGAKVRYEAYAELAERIALNGYMCVLVDMPLNLAVLNENAADSVIERFPDVVKWYICGHSMGGQAATNYGWKHQDSLKGLIVLASRIKRDFSASKLPVLLISATEDGICTPEILSSVTTPEPANFTHVVIEGGCHGYFGSYGEQKHDGTPTISREEQLDQTAESIRDFID